MKGKQPSLEIFGPGKSPLDCNQAKLWNLEEFKTLQTTLSAVLKRNIAIVTPPVSFITLLVKEHEQESYISTIKYK